MNAKLAVIVPKRTMPDEERCPKSPSMLRAYCSHCQGTQLGTPNNPIFSIPAALLNRRQQIFSLVWL